METIPNILQWWLTWMLVATVAIAVTGVSAQADINAMRMQNAEACVQNLVQKCSSSDRDLYKIDPQLAEARIRQEACAKELGDSGWVKQMSKDDVMVGHGQSCRSCASNRAQDMLTNLALCLGRSNINCCSCLFHVKPPPEAAHFLSQQQVQSGKSELNRRDVDLNELVAKVNRQNHHEQPEGIPPGDADQIIAEAVKQGIQSALGTLNQSEIRMGSQMSDSMVSQIAKQLNFGTQEQQPVNPSAASDLAKLQELFSPQGLPAAQPLAFHEQRAPPLNNRGIDSGQPAENPVPLNFDDLMKGFLMDPGAIQEQPEESKLTTEEPISPGLDLSSILGMLDAQGDTSEVDTSPVLVPDLAADILKNVDVSPFLQPASEDLPAESDAKPTEKPVKDQMPDLSSLLNFGDRTHGKITGESNKSSTDIGSKMIPAPENSLDSAPLMRNGSLENSEPSTAKSTTSSTSKTSAITVTTRLPRETKDNKSDGLSSTNKPASEDIAHEALDILKKLGANSGNISQEDIQKVVNKLESAKPELKSTTDGNRLETTVQMTTRTAKIPISTKAKDMGSTKKESAEDISEEEVVTVIEYVTDEPEAEMKPYKKAKDHHKQEDFSVEDIAKEAADERFATWPPPAQDDPNTADETIVVKTRSPLITGEAGEILNEVLKIPFDKSLAANIGKSPFSPQKVRLNAGYKNPPKPRINTLKALANSNKAKLAASQAAEDVVQDLQNGNSYIKGALGDHSHPKKPSSTSVTRGKIGKPSRTRLEGKSLSWNRHKEPAAPAPAPAPADDTMNSAESSAGAEDVQAPPPPPHQHRGQDLPPADRRSRPQDDHHHPKDEDPEADYFERVADPSDPPAQSQSDYDHQGPPSQDKQHDYDRSAPSDNSGEQQPAGYDGNPDFDYSNNHAPRGKPKHHHRVYGNYDHSKKRFKREDGKTSTGSSSSSATTTRASTWKTTEASWQTILDDLDAGNFSNNGSHSFEPFSSFDSNGTKHNLMSVLNGTVAGTTLSTTVSTTATFSVVVADSHKNTTTRNSIWNNKRASEQELKIPLN
ncbi:unnamed protein product [Notodromas monacha]|uniref:Uncharacterized protein n=1 Tax=Notodromas monacha TaxID=399045 RepID=A0A7R9GD86_9CRUS|nr:unnamed protein product [Notodromas monacha]CAG0918428.1 unnamed protein product [Notodromas monacha]